MNMGFLSKLFGGGRGASEQSKQQLRDISLEIRVELLRVRPELSLSQVDGLIEDIPRCYRDIVRDNAASGSIEWEDFWNFTLADGVAAATIYRKQEIEVLVFLADESLIRPTEHLAMVDVKEFLEIARSRFRLPEIGLKFPMSQVLPWIEHFGTGEI